MCCQLSVHNVRNINSLQLFLGHISTFKKANTLASESPKHWQSASLKEIAKGCVATFKALSPCRGGAYRHGMRRASCIDAGKLIIQSRRSQAKSKSVTLLR